MSNNQNNTNPGGVPQEVSASVPSAALRALESRFRAHGFVARINGKGVTVNLAGRPVSLVEVETVLADWTAPYHINANMGRVTIIPRAALSQATEAAK